MFLVPTSQPTLTPITPPDRHGVAVAHRPDTADLHEDVAGTRPTVAPTGATRSSRPWRGWRPVSPPTRPHFTPRPATTSPRHNSAPTSRSSHPPVPTQCMTDEKADGGWPAWSIRHPPPVSSDAYGHWIGGWAGYDGSTLSVGSTHADWPVRRRQGAELPRHVAAVRRLPVPLGRRRAVLRIRAPVRGEVRRQRRRGTARLPEDGRRARSGAEVQLLIGPPVRPWRAGSATRPRRTRASLEMRVARQDELVEAQGGTPRSGSPPPGGCPPARCPHRHAPARHRPTGWGRSHRRSIRPPCSAGHPALPLGLRTAVQHSRSGDLIRVSWLTSRRPPPRGLRGVPGDGVQTDPEPDLPATGFSQCADLGDLGRVRGRFPRSDTRRRVRRRSAGPRPTSPEADLRATGSAVRTPARP